MNDEEHARLKTLQDMVRDKDAELASLRQQLAEARATIEAKTATIDAAEQTITRLEKAVDALVVQREDALTQLAAQAAELERLWKDRQDAGTMVRRLLYQLNKLSPGLKLCEQASDWLKSKGLQGSVLREDE